jgi:ubiquinone/menaquinone biosynthesis C-methylase UbiE
MTTPPSVDAQVAMLAELYSRRAAAYDALWSPVIRPPGERLLDRLPLAGARDVIDVGCGAGALLPLIQARAPGAVVLGVDRSEGMLELARRKHPGPLAQMDAQALELPDQGFDVAVLAFMLFHLPSPQRCLEEVHRVLRGDGAIGIVTWADEHPPPANKIWDEELSAAGAQAIELPAVDSLDATNTPDKLRALLEAAGFRGEAIDEEPVAHVWPPQDHFQWHLMSTSRVRLESLDDDRRRDCLSRVENRLAQLGPEDYAFRADVLIATARKD